MKFISWNVDSLNAVLTGTSARAELSRKVMDTIAENDPDVIAFQETKLPSDGPTEKQLKILKDWLEYDCVEQFSRTGPQGYTDACFYIRIV